MIGVASKVDANRRRSRTPLNDLGGWPAQSIKLGRQGSINAQFGVEFERRSAREGSDDVELSGPSLWRRSTLPAASGRRLPPARAPVTYHCDLPPRAIGVRPSRERTNEAGTIHERAIIGVLREHECETGSPPEPPASYVLE